MFQKLKQTYYRSGGHRLDDNIYYSVQAGSGIYTEIVQSMGVMLQKHNVVFLPLIKLLGTTYDALELGKNL